MTDNIFPSQACCRLWPVLVCGLATNLTLELVYRMSVAYYPLVDDGNRYFVDLNSVPDDIIDQVQVVRDGASSTYGADAIAGVVNIITKRQFKGLTGRV